MRDNIDKADGYAPRTKMLPSTFFFMLLVVTNRGLVLISGRTNQYLPGSIMVGILGSRLTKDILLWFFQVLVGPSRY